MSWTPSYPANTNPDLITLGTINAGVTPIQADRRILGPVVRVILTAAYTTLCPPGWPTRPSMTGAEPGINTTALDSQGIDFPKTLLSGSTLDLLGGEAVALVNAGAANWV